MLVPEEFITRKVSISERKNNDKIQLKDEALFGCYKSIGPVYYNKPFHLNKKGVKFLKHERIFEFVKERQYMYKKFNSLKEFLFYYNPDSVISFIGLRIYRTKKSLTLKTETKDHNQ